MAIVKRSMNPQLARSPNASSASRPDQRVVAGDSPGAGECVAAKYVFISKSLSQSTWLDAHKPGWIEVTFKCLGAWTKLCAPLVCLSKGLTKRSTTHPGWPEISPKRYG